MKTRMFVLALPALFVITGIWESKALSAYVFAAFFAYIAIMMGINTIIDKLDK